MFFPSVILQREFQTTKTNMKTLVLIAALIAATGAMTDVSAQNKQGDNVNWSPHPHKSVKPHRPPIVSYDEASTILTVKFSSHSRGGLVEVYRDGAKVAGITANAGTTFSCVLREYGEGDYTVIVSNGNTVVDSKNFTVR
jgi:hypothetical protein